MEVQRTIHTRRHLWTIRKKTRQSGAAQFCISRSTSMDFFEGKPDASNTSTRGSVEPRGSLHRTMEMVRYVEVELQNEASASRSHRYVTKQSPGFVLHHFHCQRASQPRQENDDGNTLGMNGWQQGGSIGRIQVLRSYWEEVLTRSSMAKEENQATLPRRSKHKRRRRRVFMVNVRGMK